MDSPESVALSEAVVSTHVGSEYVPVGAMSGQYGNPLVVYLDKWGGDGANYILAPRLPLFEADTSEDLESDNFEFDNVEFENIEFGNVRSINVENIAQICNVNCTVEAPQLIPALLPVPEVGTLWMAALAMVLILGSKRLQKRFTRSIEASTAAHAKPDRM